MRVNEFIYDLSNRYEEHEIKYFYEGYNIAATELIIIPKPEKPVLSFLIFTAPDIKGYRKYFNNGFRSLEAAKHVIDSNFSHKSILRAHSITKEQIDRKLYKKKKPTEAPLFSLN
jgi:hypothetical protein